METQSVLCWLLCTAAVLCHIQTAQKQPFCFSSFENMDVIVQYRSVTVAQVSSTASKQITTFFLLQTLQSKLFQVSSATVKYSGPVTEIPSPVIPGWPLLCLSAIATNNPAQ